MSAQEVLEQYLVASFGDREGKIVAGEIRDILRAAGYVVAPREPTQRMIQAVAQLDFSAQHDPTWPEYYAAMLAAAEGDAL